MVVFAVYLGSVPWRL